MAPFVHVHVLAPASLAAFLLVLLRFAISKWLPRRAVTNDAPLPPGPKALPVLGNVHQLPASYQEQTFAEWARQYGGFSPTLAHGVSIRRRRRVRLTLVASGDVVFAKIFRRPVLVLGSLRAAQDLLEKKSGNFSDRPRLILLSEL